MTTDTSGDAAPRLVRDKNQLIDESIISVRTTAQERIQTAFPVTTELLPGQRTAINACIQALDLLQKDTALDFDNALTCNSKREDLRNPSLPGFEKINRFYGLPPNELKYYIGNKQVIFLLISNIFNRLDELGEKAVAVNPKNDSKSIGADFLMAVLHKAKLSDYQTADGENKRATFFEMIGFVKVLAGLWGVETSSWDQHIEGIVKAQAEGMDLLAESRQAGKITYSVDQALDYRHKTVGEYVKLLADIIYINPRIKRSFVKRTMGAQIDDDKIDMIDDLNSQVNPFVALLAEHNLIGVFREYIAKDPKIIDAYADRYLGRFYAFIGGKEQIKLIFETKKIERQYKDDFSALL